MKSILKYIHLKYTKEIRRESELIIQLKMNNNTEKIEKGKKWSEINFSLSFATLNRSVDI